MALVGLPNLYASYNDICDYLSAEGVELRLDDHSLATGQEVQVTVAASQGATTVKINALEQALLSGAVLNFDGAGLSAQVQVILTATAPLGANSLTVLPLSAALPINAFAVDHGINIATNARVMKAQQYATGRVKLYCCARYNDSDLATSWSVNRWATTLAARWLCKRRGQGVPQGIEDDYEETMEEMKRVQAGQLQIEDISTRTADWPSWSNVTIDQTYDVNRVRVETSSSDPYPTQYSIFLDWWDATNFDF